MLSGRDVQAEMCKDRRGHLGVGIPEAQVRERDLAFGNDQVFGAFRIVHQARFVQDHGHVVCVAEGVVNALHDGCQHVQAERQVVGVGKHHHQGTGADAEPGVAARQEESQDRHDRHDHGGGDGS